MFQTHLYFVNYLIIYFIIPYSENEIAREREKITRKMKIKGRLQALVLESKIVGIQKAMNKI